MREMILMPVYNENHEALKLTISRIRNVTDAPIVIVDDGNDDPDLKATIGNISDFVITHKRNLGYMPSMRDGLEFCLKNGAGMVVKLDADGQYFPEHIPIMLAKARKSQADIISVSRYHSESVAVNHYPEREKISEIIRNEIEKRFAVRVTDPFSGYRCFSRKFLLSVIDDLGSWINEFGYGLSLEFTLKAITTGARIIEIPGELYYPTLKKFPGKMSDSSFRLPYYLGFFEKALEYRRKAA